MRKNFNNLKKHKTIAIIVAHPDDETLWAGGTILANPQNSWFVVCLCRASDRERSVRFHKAMNALNAQGVMGDLDDGPEQYPLDEKMLEQEILRLLPAKAYDLIITHNITGEYTKHLRHEEVNKAVLALFYDDQINSNELWTFAYEDGNKSYYPQIVQNANILKPLSKGIWQHKYNIITDIYGFDKDSWEAKTTPHTEAFWRHTKYHKSENPAALIEIEMARSSIFKLLGNRHK